MDLEVLYWFSKRHQLGFELGLVVLEDGLAVRWGNDASFNQGRSHPAPVSKGVTYLFNIFKNLRRRLNSALKLYRANGIELFDFIVVDDERGEF